MSSLRHASGPPWTSRSSDLIDPFVINPIRRSFAMVVICGAAVIFPAMIGGAIAETILLAGGWLAGTGLVLGIPVLIWSLVEEAWRQIRRRMVPDIEQLGLSPRVAHVLRRHGLESIAEVDAASDSTLLLLSNMDGRGVQEIRRAISLWHYRRWQELGFPSTYPR